MSDIDAIEDAVERFIAADERSIQSLAATLREVHNAVNTLRTDRTLSALARCATPLEGSR